jgi:FtsZ-binding cell division protein ZapB
MRLSIDERKKYVIQLHKKGYTDRQIAEELRMSSRDIVKVRKENEREEKEARETEEKEKAEEEKKKLFSSKRTEALKLYKKGTTPVDVAIKLDISAEEAKTIYCDYCSLTSPFHFRQVYTELDKNDSFKAFTDLFHRIKEKDLSIEEAIGGIEMINDIYLLKEEHQALSNNIANLEKLRDSLIADNKFFKVQNEEMEKRLNSILEKIDIKEKTLEVISNKVRQIEKEIYKINSGENYFKAKDKIKLLIEEILGYKKKVIALAVSAVFDAVKENHHQKEIPIKDLSKSVYEYVSDSSDEDVYRQKLQDAAEKVWDSISDVCTHDVLNPSSNISKN